MCVFSVLLCNYNYAGYLREAIESVLNQSFGDFELIIVDDGSTDNSREIINSYHDERIIKLFQENKGQAAAFNAGFDLCQGQYIAFLDSDDYWYPDKLMASYKAFDTNNVVAVQHSLDVVDESSNQQGWVHPKLKSGLKDILKDYFRENHTGFFSATSGIVACRNILTGIFPIDSNWKICADVAFTRPLPIYGKFYNLDAIMGCYRVHDLNNWMNTDHQMNYLENEKRYVDYTNGWLAKNHINKTLMFEKSRPYKIAKILNSRLGFIYIFVRKLRHGLNGFFRAKFT